ncbi:S1 family peptidase [Actinoalloteichus hymeniacidonis]|uniref:Alpha-lytic protease proenzyme n=1 Tax=Actinoalloteichus hymeniacidonis TaxID=340345 RepID=A0AAC9MWX6_9PSEU|nr:S1 family peptidase [Actinoalloteichus hymeniacidonis]AOS61262.1 Alpha-lytic protease proenzyme [Actinoalloteichus hymeniacidonis]MBB5910735.1 streptogrisin C [Actinoalloteichus hymeniacidonis]
MNRRFAARVTGAMVLAAGTAVGLSFPAVADTAADPAAESPKTTVAPEMLTAMQRDLGLTEAQATARIAQEARAVTAETELRDTLGSTFGGAVFDSELGKLVVGVTDADAAAEVRAAGAVPNVVEYGVQELESVVSSIDTLAKDVPAGINSWGVNAADNSVVVTVDETAVDAATEAFLAEAGALSDAVTVVEEKGSPVPLADIVGGDPYYFGGSRCSIGFSVEGGYVTAGHCGTVGTATQGSDNSALGTVAGSTFPGADMAWVETNSSWTPAPLVNDYEGGTVTVTGSTEAAVGASICRSGSTTGWQCGEIEGKGQSVSYPQGTVNGLTQTSACAEGGDSGGSWLSGTEAQGVTSGGSGNCSFGGTTFFQPLNPILSEYGLTLVTG